VVSVTSAGGFAVRTQSVIARIAAIIIGLLVLVGLAASPANASPTTPSGREPAAGAPLRGLPPHVQPATPPVVPKPTAHPATPAATRPAPVTEQSATAQARATHKAVAVTADTTDTTDVVANPDGTLTMHSSVLPVRTQRNGAWVPLDPTLQANPDGTYSPAASADGVTFSGGGVGPMVTLTHGAGTLALTWPHTLPAPTVHGDTATYASVLPGVDLELTATASDYREVLVVRDATAAANPALAAIKLTATAHGLTLHTDPDVGLTATDPHGTVVFRDATPIMWDSTVDPTAGPAPSAAAPGTGQVSQLGIKATASTTSAQLTIVPDPAALTGPHVTYPLYIDPEMQPGESHWAEVTKNGWHYYDASMFAQVGDCTGWSGCGGLTVARSYFEFPTPALDNPSSTAAVYGATLTINEAWNAAGCNSATQVDIDQTGPIGPNMAWPGPAYTQLDNPSSAGSENCNANVLGNVVVGAAAAASGRWPTLTLGLRAPDEGNNIFWKKFTPASAVLSVTYKYPPNAATGLAVANSVTCNGTTYVPDGPTTLVAAATDNNNPPLDPSLWFDVTNNGFATQTSSGPLRIASGTTGSWTVPATLAPGGYQWRVSVDNDPNQPDDQWGGTVASSAAFTRLAAPTQTPIVSTGQYPNGYWGEPADNPGGIGFFGNGAQHLAGFTWTLDGAGTEDVPDTGQCDYDQTFSDSNGDIVGGYVSADGNGNAAVNLPAGLSVGYHTIYARGFDFAHNLTPESAQYVIYVAAPVGAASHWQEAETTTYTQPAGQLDGLAQQNNCCGVAWSGNAQLFFGGQAAGQSFSMTFQVATSQNYEIAPVLTKANDYGILSFRLDNTPITVNGRQSFDTYSSEVTKTYVDLGTAYLDASKPHTLTVTAVGTNPASVGNRYQAGIDGWNLVVTNQLDAESSLAVPASDLSGQGITPTIESNDATTNWPGGAQLVYPATAANQSVQLGFQVMTEADYALGIGLTQSPDAGALQFTVDGTTVLDNSNTSPFDGYFTAERYYYLPLGGAHLLPGSHTITIKVTGKNNASTGFKVGIGQLTAAAVDNATAASFTAAMNNHGFATDGNPAGANFDGGYTISTTALASAGLTPTSTLTTGGASFTLAKAPNGDDNVIADGQTIPLPNAGNDTAVGLLVASSCGWTSDVPAAINYTNDTFSNPLVPSVPDWIYGTGATVTVPYIDSNGALVTNRAAHLYEVFLPTNPKLTIKSITLPYTATGMENYGCNTTDHHAALHVFAIAPRPVDPAPAGGGTWLGAWSAPIDAAALPPGGTLSGHTVRMVVHPTTTGSAARIRLSDLDGSGPLTVDSATVAAQAGTTGTGAAAIATPTALTFAGSSSVTIPAGGEIDSDQVAFPATTGGSGNLLVSLHFSTAPTQVPVHATTTNATYLSGANTTTNTDGTPFGPAVPGDYVLTGVDVAATVSGGTIAVLGDQTSVAGAPGGTCGGGSAYACTWVDDLAAAGGTQIPGSILNASRAGTPPQDEWRLGDGTGTTATDPIGGHPATASGGVTWNTGQAGNTTGSVTLNGTGYLATSGHVLDTTQSFSVSAWVDPTSLGSAFQTFLVQQAGTASGFSLEYDPGTQDWSFARAETDTTNPVIDRAESASPAQANTWTYLTGTFDAGTGALLLYVNGSYAGSTVDNTKLASNGPLVIGHGFSNGAANNYVTGGIADVQVYQRALNPADVVGLSEQQGPQQPAAGAGAPSAYDTAITNGTNTQVLATNPATELDQLLAGEPNLRTVIVSFGANDILDRANLAMVKQDLTAMILKGRAFGLTNRLRPDGSQIQIVLTTIPPLGLSPSDQREQTREQVNADIAANYANYGADGFVDFDKAVTAPTAGQVAPNLLTNGLPNATYYTDLANTVLAALRFPPKITL
jgi:hypothetical protein